MLYTGSFKNIDPDRYDEIWIVVRQLSAVPRNPKGNIRHVRTLSPSKRLLFESKDAQHRKIWDQAYFDTVYAPAFLREMLGSPYAMDMLDQLAKLSKEKNVLIACYCADGSQCHRSLIRKIIARLGGTVEEREPCP